MSWKGPIVACSLCGKKLREERLYVHQQHPECRVYQNMMTMFDADYVLAGSAHHAMDRAGVALFSATSWAPCPDYDNINPYGHDEGYMFWIEAWCPVWAMDVYNHCLEKHRARSDDCPKTTLCSDDKALLIQKAKNSVIRELIFDDWKSALHMIKTVQEDEVEELAKRLREQRRV